MTKVIIAGSRDITDFDLVSNIIESAIKELNIKVTEVVCGECRGVDLLGKKWGEQNGVNIISFPAKWDDISAPNAIIKTNRYGKKYNANAGFSRNQDMADYADALIAINIGGTPGTKDMVKRAKKNKLKVYEYTPEPLEDEFEYEF